LLLVFASGGPVVVGLEVGKRIEVVGLAGEASVEPAHEVIPTVAIRYQQYPNPFLLES
jgi:hypothetical protein